MRKSFAKRYDSALVVATAVSDVFQKNVRVAGRSDGVRYEVCDASDMRQLIANASFDGAIDKGTLDSISTTTTTMTTTMAGAALWTASTRTKQLLLTGTN